MQTHFNENQKSRHLVDAEEIWGIHFFWTKDLNFREDDLKKATEQAMHRAEVKNEQEHFEKHSREHGFHPQV